MKYYIGDYSFKIYNKLIKTFYKSISLCSGHPESTLHLSQLYQTHIDLRVFSSQNFMCWILIIYDYNRLKSAL